MLQIAQVPMEDGVSMYYFLPDDVTKNLTLIEEALTAEFVQDLANTLHSVQVQLTLPVLKLGYSTDLFGPLSDVGKTSQLWFGMTCFRFLISHFVPNVFLRNFTTVLCSPLFFPFVRSWMYYMPRFFAHIPHLLISRTIRLAEHPRA